MKYKKYSSKERVMFAKKMAYLLGGGMSIVESISLLESEYKQKKALYLRKIRSDLVNGKTFCQSLGQKNILFDQMSLRLLRMGEMTGTLAKTFEQVSLVLEKRRAMRSKIQTALFYPAVIIFVACVLIIVLLVYVFPRIISVFGSMNAKVPLITRIFMDSGQYLQKFGLIAGGVVSAFILLLFFLLKKNTYVKRKAEATLLLFPLMRNQLQPFFLKQYCLMFGLLLKSGLSIVETALIVEEASASVLYEESCRDLAVHVQHGKKCSLFFKSKSFLFPALFSSLIHAGESTGNLSGTFIYLAEIYEEIAEVSLSRMTALIEPLLMIFIGVFVGALAVAIISPVYQLTSSLSLK